MIDLPEKAFLTRSDILNSNLGISRYDLDQMVAAGTLTRVYFGGARKRSKYRRSELVKVLGLKAR